jgi:hypothetical protein
MAKITITISPKFLEEKTDLSYCSYCNDMIFGEMFRLWLVPDNKKLPKSKTDILCCGACERLLEN